MATLVVIIFLHPRAREFFFLTLCIILSFAFNDFRSINSGKLVCLFSTFLGFLFRGNCTCKTAYCNRVVKADKFLFPFLIEFCLISTCLLYVTWRKVGKKAMPLRRIFKPCYKLFKAYKGTIFLR